MANKVIESTKSFFGLSKQGPFLQREDFEALASVAEPASADIESAMSHIELKRITGTALNIMSEVLTIALINVVASGNQELQSTLAWPIFGLLSATTLTKSTLLNWQYRLNDIAIQRVFTYLQTIDGLQNSEKKHLLSQWQSDINSMSRAELQFGNLPSNKLFWLTSKLINIAYLFPELTPVIIGQWFLSILQISGNTKAFQYLQSQFQSVVQENSTSMKLHAKNTKAEKLKEKVAMLKVTVLTTIINTITRSASLPFIWALANGATLPTLIATSLPSLNTLSSEVSETLGSAIGAHIQFTAAAIGRERLENILDQIQKTQVMIQNHNDRKKHREKLADEKSIEESFKEKNIPIPQGVTSLLFSEVCIPRPADNVMLIENLTGYVLLETGKVTIITGGSGKGKSLLAETILQNYLKSSGRTGISSKEGIITDFRDEATNHNEFGLYVNEDDMPGDIYWADLAFPYNLQVALIATANFDIHDPSITEFLRLSWGDKTKNANKTQTLTKVFKTIQKHLESILSETGLFIDPTKQMSYYLSQEIGHYSDGEKQRLFLSSVYLIPNLPLVIIDEPFRALDSSDETRNTNSSKKAMAEFLLKLENRGTDVIIITHENDTEIKSLLGESIGCQIHLDNGQLVAKKGYENMVQLTSTPLLSEHNVTDEILETEETITLGKEVILKIEESLLRLDDLIKDAKSSYITSFNRLDPSKHPEVKKEIKSIINLFEQVVGKLGRNQKINSDILATHNWELIGEAIYFYLDTSDDKVDFVKTVTIFETIFSSLDSAALTKQTNPVYKGQQLTEFLYEYIHLAVTNRQREFETEYVQKVKSQYSTIVSNTKESQQDEQQKLPIYPLTLEEIESLREIVDSEHSEQTVKDAITLLKSNISQPEKNLEAQKVIDNFFRKLEQLKQFIVKKSETNTVEIGLEIFSEDDWRLITNLLDTYFIYLQEDQTLEFTEKQEKYHQALEICDVIFYAMTEKANNLQVDWLENEYSLKLVVYGLLDLIIHDDLVEYQPDPKIVSRIEKRYQILVNKDQKVKRENIED